VDVLERVDGDGDLLEGAVIRHELPECRTIRRRVGDEEVGVAGPAQPERLPQGVRHHPAEALVREGPVEEVAHPDRLARDPDRTAGGTSGEVGRIGVEGVDVGDGEGGGAPARRPVPGGGSVHASRYYLSVTSVRRSAKR